MKYKFANHVSNMNISAIREIFKVLGKPGMISFAGGAPAPEVLPLDIINKLNSIIIEKYGTTVLQYNVTEGFVPLRQALSNYLNTTRGFDLSANEVFVSTGAQNAIDAVSRLFIDVGDKIIVESPTFLASIKTFRVSSPAILSVSVDEEGINLIELETLLKQNKIKFLYTIPNFQNPSGYTMSLDRRQQLVELAKRYELLIIEDDPYYELRYYGSNLPTLRSLLPDQVIYIGSLSKIFAPGMRLGYYIAPDQIAEKITSVRQGIDVHANIYAQALASEYISGGYLETQLQLIRNLYRVRLELMLSELNQKLSNKEIKISQPLGGMFVWLSNISQDTVELYNQAIKQNVAFVPGKYFFVNESPNNHSLRLNFTNVNEENIIKGIDILSKILK
jgi:2-aminoadipate transaminase